MPIIPVLPSLSSKFPRYLLAATALAGLLYGCQPDPAPAQLLLTPGPGGGTVVSCRGPKTTCDALLSAYRQQP